MQSVEEKILDHAGPVVNMRTFWNKFNANSRPTKEETEQPMVKLQDEGFGKFVKSGNTAAFLKQLSSAADEGKLQFYMSKMSYKDVFSRKNFDLAKQLLGDLLSKDPLGDSIKEYLQEQQEHRREW